MQIRLKWTKYKAKTENLCFSAYKPDAPFSVTASGLRPKRLKTRSAADNALASSFTGNFAVWGRLARKYGWAKRTGLE